MEIIVSKEKDNFITLLSAVIVIVAIVFLILLFRFAGVVVFIPAPFVIFASAIFARHIYINNNKVEFEYSLNAGILNIDRIINQSKRYPVIKIQVSDILTFGRYSDNDTGMYKESKKADKFVDCGSGRDDSNLYYFTCNFENRGIYMFVFEPGAKILSTMKSLNSIINKSLLTDR